MDKASLLTLSKATGLLRPLLATLRRGGAWLSVCLLFLWSPALAAGSGTSGDPFTTLSDAYTVSSGRYFFNTGSGLFQADVDNSEGGGWVLVLQYVHQGGTNPPLSVLGAGSDFPVTSTAALGADESAITSNWGHAGNLAMSQFAGDIELRWYGQTSGHNRIIHFRTTLGDGYVKTGSGPDNFASLSTNFTALTGHSANIPATTNGIFSNGGNNALTNFPFFQGVTAHWGIRGINNDTPGASGNRWEVDDFPSSAANDTIHRVWVRQTNPLVVTNTNDSGEGSLRQAITVANNNAQLDDITFAIPGTGPHEIALSSVLIINDADITIDGSTQPGASCGTSADSNGVITDRTIGIEIGSADDVFRVQAANTTIRGFALGGQTGPNEPIDFNSGGSGSVLCNHIGFRADGLTAWSISQFGIETSGDGGTATSIDVGDGTLAGRNVIGNTGFANIQCEASSLQCSVRGNYLNVAADGFTRSSGSGGASIIAGGQNSSVGGPGAFDGNVIAIAGNRGVGLTNDASNLTIEGNFIGVAADGVTSLQPSPPAGTAGIQRQSGSGSATVTIRDNVIGGVDDAAIDLNGLTFSSAIIAGNSLGIGDDGSTDIGTTMDYGINLGSQSHTDLTIGGTSAADRNVIGNAATDGILMTGTSGVTVLGNYIGLQANGMSAAANGVNGINLDGASNIDIGDGSNNGRNVISSNATNGVNLTGGASTITIDTNTIGLAADGSTVRGNTVGVSVNGGGVDNLTVNGNVVSANSVHGMNAGAGATATNITITSNFIGTDITGLVDRGNGDDGIQFNVGGTGTTNNVIIGTPGNGNVISGNNGRGFAISDVGSATVQANLIGVGTDGTTPLGNNEEGATLDNTTFALFGGTGAGEGNTVANNGLEGVGTGPSATVAILGNTFSNNGELGIDLGRDGFTDNDPGDTDTGVNDLLNFPVLNLIQPSGAGGTDIAYDLNLDVPANTNGYRIEFFRNATPDPSGNGEGQEFIGSVDLVPHTGGDQNFTGTFTPSVPVTIGDSISATATRITASAFDITSEFSANQTVAAGLVVTNTNDSGAGSLRSAINFANANTSEDNITFNIPNAGPHTINLLTQLPSLADDGITVDASTQPDASCGTLVSGTQHDLRIELQGGGSVQEGLQIAANNVTIRGLTFGSFFNHAINQPNNVSGTIVECNYFGVRADGITKSPNVINNSATPVVRFLAGSNITVSNNLISGNDDDPGDYGLRFDNTGSATVTGNIIGLNAAGTAALGNGDDGIYVHNGADGVTIGGTSATDRNIVSGNGASGIRLDGDLNTTILGNTIGLDRTAASAVGNGLNGIESANSSGLQIGDGTAAGRNIISGNADRGIDLIGTQTNITIDGNFIGTDSSGNAAIASGGATESNGDAIALNAFAVLSNITVTDNVIGGYQASYIDLFSSSGSDVAIQGNKLGIGDDGTSNISASAVEALIAVTGAGTLTNLTIGGSGAGEGNTLNNSGRSGIRVDKTLSNAIIENNTITGSTDHGINVIRGNVAILSNTLSNNGGLGIDLNDDGVTINDGGDPDTGPNDLLNFPLINSFAADGTTSVDYDINLDVPGNPDGYRIEFFKNANLETYGEGEIYLGSVDVAHAGGNLNFTGTFTANAVVNTGDYISATTTRKTGAVSFDITSEFAQTATATAPPSPLIVTSTADTNTLGTLRFAINHANANAADDAITFNIPGTGPHRIDLLSTLPIISDSGVSIDGTTQTGTVCGDLWSGAAHTLQIQINSTGSDNVLRTNAANTTFRGLSLTNGSNGIEFGLVASNNTVQCNYIGLAPDGTVSANVDGISINADDHLIGGPNATDGNVIAGNTTNNIFLIRGNRTTVQNNLVGVLPGGTTAPVTQGRGFTNNFADDVLIDNNLVSGNGSFAYATGPGASTDNITFTNNFIGTDRTGTAALDNGNDGIHINVSDPTSANNIVIGTPGNGNVIAASSEGIEISNGTTITIQDNIIGGDVNGTADLGNRSAGIRLGSNVIAATIGGTGTDERNIIIGNAGDGINISAADGIDIFGNYIGLGADGTTRIANDGDGIQAEGTSNLSIGDGTTAGRNVISGNANRAIEVQGTLSNISINGNFIGTDVTGNTAVASGGNNMGSGDAISMGNGANITTATVSNNVIGGYRSAYIEFFDATATGVTIQGNNVGVGADGTSNISASTLEPLVFLSGTSSISNLVIGGTGPGEGNRISNGAFAGIFVGASDVSGIAEGNTITDNAGDGIEVSAGSLAILSNTLSNNGGLGIDLASDGVTENDENDADTGPNDLLNFPLINSLTADGTTSVDYDINLDVPGNPDGYRIEFFKNANLETYGEGEIYLGSVDVAHAGGNLNFTGTFTANAAVNTGDYISATTTRKTGAVSFDVTSEFAQTATATAPPSPLIVTSTADTNTLGTLRFAINHANANAADDAITFNIPGTGPHVITLASALPEITDGDVSIDGTTQSGASCGDLWGGTPHTLTIRIDGPSAFNGLNINADNITVKGLSITGFDSGIVAADGSSVTIQCNYIGIAPDGSAAGQLGDADSQGIILVGSINSLIGGPNATDGNVIGNGAGNGLVLAGGATGLGIQNNFIGTNPAGTAAAPLLDGVKFGSGAFTLTRLSDNIISGATRDGVAVFVGASLTGTSGDMLVQGNYIGVDRTGNAPLSNGRAGWRGNTGSTFNGITFGGGNAGQGNVISANAAQGILLSSGGANLTFLGNNIGVGANGTADLGNGGDGIAIVNATTVLIGDGSTDGRNIIAANAGSGLSLAEIDGLTINGNYIGIGGDGSTALGHGSRGMTLNSRPTESGIQNAVVTNNIVSNNAAGGIDITSGRVAQLGASSAITLTRNTIGLAANGTTAAGNGNYGVKNTNVPGAIIVGGIDPADGNTIAHSTGGPGIEVRSEQGTTIAILSNSIFSNDGVSIDLNPGTIDGVTANDNGDPDTGPNDLLNFPLINSFTTNGMTSVDYDINLDVPGNPDGYRIEFFKNTTADPTGHGEGEIYLGFVDVAHAGGNLNFTGSFTANASVSVSDNISATTTRKTGTLTYDITSEFAQNKLAVSNDPAVLSVTKTVDNLVAGEYFLPGNDVVYTFSVVNSGGGSVTADSIVLIDLLPPELTFFNGDHDGAGPSTAVIGFAETGTSLTFNPATDALYSDAAIKPTNLAECDYTPTPGYDPNVTFVCFNPKGEMLGGDPDPNFTLKFRAGIK